MSVVKKLSALSWVLLLLLFPSSILFAQVTWINEFHYNDVGTDDNEFIEVIIQNASQVDLTRYSVIYYDGISGVMQDSVNISNLSASAQAGNYSIYQIALDSLNDQAGLIQVVRKFDGFSFPQAMIVYGQDVTTADGPFANTTYTKNITLEESASTPNGSSLHLTGFGNTYTDFTWEVATENATAGAVNAGQSFASNQASLAFSTLSATEEAETEITITVNLDEAVTQASYVDVDVNEAIYNTDFTVVDGDITVDPFTSLMRVPIASGQQSRSFTLKVLDDNDIEEEEEIEINLVATSSNLVVHPDYNLTRFLVIVVDNDVYDPGQGIFPEIRLAIDKTVLNEESQETATITLSLDHAEDSDISVEYRLRGNTLTADEYVISGSELIIPRGQTTATVTVQAIDDLVEEGTENWVLVFGSPSAVFTDNIKSYDITVNDSDNSGKPVINFYVDKTELIEGSESQLRITVQADQVLNSSQNVSLDISGVGVKNSDYTLSANPVVINAGEQSKEVILELVDDLETEYAEIFNIQIVNPSSGIAIGRDNIAQVTAYDNESNKLPVTISISSNSIQEGSSTPFRVTASLPTPVSSTQTVQVRFEGDGVTSGDFDLYAAKAPASTSTSFSYTITIPRNSRSGSATFLIADDNQYEGPEDVRISAEQVTADLDVIEGQHQILRIIDNDEPTLPVVNLEIAQDSVYEGFAGTYEIEATLTDFNQNNQYIVLDFSGEAVEGVDFSVTNDTLFFRDGATSSTTQLTVLDDSNVEAVESLIIKMENKSSFLSYGFPRSDTLWVVDNDATGGAVNVDLSVSNTTITEGSTDNTSRLTFTLDRELNYSVFVNFAVTGTNITSGDYSLSSPSPLEIPAGSTIGTVDLTITDDITPEATESATVTLQNGSGYQLGASTAATLTFIDNDPVRTLSLQASATRLYESERTRIVITGFTDAPVSDNQSFSISLSGTAAFSSDVFLENQTLTIPHNESSASTIISAVQNDVDEPIKYVTLRLQDVSDGLNIGPDNEVTITVMDEPIEQKTFDLSLSKDGLFEGDTLQIKVKTSDVVYADQWIQFSFDGISSSDYSLSSDSLHILAGDSVGTINLIATEDSEVEGTEFAELSILALSEELDPSETDLASFNLYDANSAQSVTLFAAKDYTLEADEDTILIYAKTQAAVSGPQFVKLNSTGVARLNQDFSLSSDTLWFADGADSTAISLYIHDDVEDEFITEVISLEGLSMSEGITAIDNQIDILIEDDEFENISVAIEPSVIRVEESNDGPIRFTVKTDRAVELETSFTLEYSSNTAVAGEDYLAEVTEITIPAGADSASFELSVLDDVVTEITADTVLISLATTSDMVVLNQSSFGRLIIADNDLPRTVSRKSGNTRMYEGESTTFTFVTSEPLPVAADLHISLYLYSESNIQDYTISQTDFTLNPGDSLITFDVAINEDRLDEGTEILQLAFSSETPILQAVNEQILPIRIYDKTRVSAFNWVVPSFDVVEEEEPTLRLVLKTDKAVSGPQQIALAINSDLDFANEVTLSDTLFNLSDGSDSLEVFVNIQDDDLDEGEFDTILIQAFARSEGVSVTDANAMILVSDDEYRPDVLPPSVPSELRSTQNDTSIVIAWNDNNEVDFAYFKIYRAEVDGPQITSEDLGVLIGDRLEDASFLDRQVFNSYNYVYSVTAVDTAGNESAPAQVSVSFVGTDIDEETLPTQITLYQNYPNPFNPSTTIVFDLTQTAKVQLDVFNINGQKVSTLVSGNLNAGQHRQNFEAGNLPSGVYIYRLVVDGKVIDVSKMTLLK